MAEQKREPMNTDLLRQRRNLLISSLVLVAIDLAGATLKKDVAVLGTSLEFSNPERIIFGVWIIWGYFLIRYWQYFNEEVDLGIHKEMNKIIFRRFDFDESDYDVTYWISWRYCIFWSLLCQRKDSEEHDFSIAAQEPKSKLLKAFWTLQAFVSVATKTPRFTDYLMPFFIASFPLILKIWDVFIISN